MFGSGNKDKLRENMEEIKQMVEDGESMDPSESQDDFKPVQEEPDFEDSQQDVSEEDIESFGQELEQEFQKQSQKNANEEQDTKESQGGNNDVPAQPRQEPSADNEEFSAAEESTPARNQDNKEIGPNAKADNPESRPDVSKDPQPPKRDNRVDQRGQSRRENRHNSGGGQRGQKPNTRGLEADIPEPAQTKEISVPEIEKGPLFIRREKFEQASRLIQEMRYISEQIEATVNTIEEDLQRDQTTENQVRELLSGFEEDRTKVERIVSPKEN